MIGAIAGDFIGSVYEHRPIKTKDFPLLNPRCRFTDDSVLTIAVAQAILDHLPYQETIRHLGRRHPNAGYGGAFRGWLFSEHPQPYNSWGNGAAMRVSAIGYAFDTDAEVMDEARRSAEITHSHPEGIKGAQAPATAVLMARQGQSKEAIRAVLSDRFRYDLNRTVDAIRPNYQFDISCQGTVPEAIIAFLDSNSYEDAIRNAICLGGDSDTIACITGGVAEAFYGGIPPEIEEFALIKLTPDLKDVFQRFRRTYPS